MLSKLMYKLTINYSYTPELFSKCVLAILLVYVAIFNAR